MDFTEPSYLLKGNLRQQSAYWVLSELNIFSFLAEYHPILTGTVPIGIDISASDLDISCEVHKPKLFVKQLAERYGKLTGFQVQKIISNYLLTTVVRLRYQDWLIELFGQPLPAVQQHAYRHMIIEHRILQIAGKDFRKRITELKREGMKTEPAFAQLLNLTGDPYESMLSLECYSDDQLQQRLFSEKFSN